MGSAHEKGNQWKRNALSYHRRSPSTVTTDPSFPRWEQADHGVFTWLVQNMESKLVGRVSQHEKAKDVWDSLEVTYTSGGDSIQIYDLLRRAMTLKQGGETLEDVWTTITEIWTAIDHKDPNLMETPKDIERENIKTQNLISGYINSSQP